MKKYVIGFILLLVLWFGLKNIAFKTYLSSGPLALPAAPNYESDVHWATKPEILPPGAWVTPWGIDAFLVLPPANTARKHGLLSIDDEAVTKEVSSALEKLSVAIPGEIPVYAPLYRAPSPASKTETLEQLTALAASDLTIAFDHYMATDNQARGVMLLIGEGAGEVSQPLLDLLQSEDLSGRFAGLVSFGPADSAYPDQSLSCADILNGACHQRVETKGKGSLSRLFLPSLRRNSPALNVIDASGVAAAIKVQAENVSTWMDETQPKPAEPFFATEVIQNAPIYRPGEETPIDQPNED